LSALERHGGALDQEARQVLLRLQEPREFVADVFRNGCDLQAVLEAKGAMDADMSYAFAQLYNYTARTLFFHDRTAFRDSVARLYALEPGFRLTWPKGAKLASKMFGFNAAGMVLSLLTNLRCSPRE
jgi:hypothetical protein